MTQFLEVEIHEISTISAPLTMEQFNEWFDKSPIKARFKKACMLAQGLRCCYCTRYLDSDSSKKWDLEHVLAEKLYPQFFATIGNLVLACEDCNLVKSQKDALVDTHERPPTTLPPHPDDYVIPHPILTEWDDHLSHTNFMLYQPKSLQGAALIQMCGLNQRVLKQAGLSPESVATTAAENFFRIMQTYIPDDIRQETALDLSAQLIEAGENQRRNILLEKLRRTLVTMERAALRRNAWPVPKISRGKKSRHREIEVASEAAQ
ncbi:HNH endonuclease [Rhizobium ruizarguesonis]|uniref:HNH endonuclease n=1 Tax=Rhizobium ruizarguesonis TaxID=2081791 RepID=UPI001031F71C|nr:hypothetical protein [Rhizobium ruizarguesonis]TBA24687.1 hypothetical protein ELH61_02240 [Rhizobium ruizarguesonis]